MAQSCTFSQNEAHRRIVLSICEDRRGCYHTGTAFAPAVSRKKKCTLHYSRKGGKYEFYSVAHHWRHPRMDRQSRHGDRRAAGGIPQYCRWGDRCFVSRVLADTALWRWYH